MDDHQKQSGIFWKLIAAALVALFALYVLNMGDKFKADREHRIASRERVAAVQRQALSERPAVISESKMGDESIRVIEVPKRSMLGVEMVTCVLYTGTTSSLSCLGDGMPVFE